MKLSEASPAVQRFMQEIMDQLPPIAQGLFQTTLVQLGKPSEEDQVRLDKLAALERNGVDNWAYYDDAMEELTDDEEDDDE